MVPEDRQGNINPALIVHNFFNHPEALIMLRRAILSEDSCQAPKAHHPQLNNVGALKAQETEATFEGQAIKRPRRADSLLIAETDDNAELKKRTACPIFILLAGVRRSVFIFGSDTTHRLRKTL